MNQKRKAELQRKLSMTSVPKPPAGLAERIKADIPHDLMNVSRERDRFSPTAGFSLRVAASVILMISAVYIAVNLASRSDQAKSPALTVQRSAEKVERSIAQPAAPQAEVTITLAENRPAAAQRSQPAPARREAAVQQSAPSGVAESRRVADVSSNEEPREATGAVTGGIAALSAPATAPAPPPPPPPPPSVAAPARAQTAANVAAEDRVDASRAAAKQNATVTAEAPIVSSAHAAGLQLEPPRSVFGLSVDPKEFDRVKHDLLEEGTRPAAGSVDVAALVNYFGGTARPPRHDVRFDVEASRAPLAPESSALVRFTIDTPREDVAPGSSLPPVATNAELEIRLNSDAVASHRIVGAEELKTQATLLKNTSVTGVLDMKLKPGVKPRTIIAIMTLSYRSAVDGKRKVIPRDIHASDVERKWSSASTRHRIATLGAVWSESLNSGEAADALARTAQELASEAPDDPRAKELAAVASASSRLQSSGPTGSGR